MMRKIGMIVLTIATMAQADPAVTAEADAEPVRAEQVATVVATEADYVTELLALKQLDLAEQHLAVIRKLAPERRALVRSLEGDIHVAGERWLEALDRYSGIRREGLDDASWLHIEHGRFRACMALDRHAAASTILDEVPAGETRPEWAVEGDYTLGMLLMQKAANDPDAIARGDRDRAVIMLERFSTTLDEEQQPGWVQLQEASVYHDRLLLAAAELSNADTALDIPDPLRPFALRIRGLYRRIQIRHPGTKNADVATERIELIERMMRGEAAPVDDDDEVPTP